MSKELLDVFAGLAMQSLMQHWLHLDESGLNRREYADAGLKGDFCSLASGAMACGWGSAFPNTESNQSCAEQLAGDAYFIALSMLKTRSEFHGSIDKGIYAKTTKKSASTEDAGRVHDDGGSVLDVHSNQPAPDVLQVGSTQAHSGDVQATEPE